MYKRQIDIYALKEYDNTSLTTTFSMPYDGCIDINWVYDGNIDCIEKEKNTTLINIPGITSVSYTHLRIFTDVLRIFSFLRYRRNLNTPGPLLKTAGIVR